jgi:hypothetical protein
MPGSATRRIIIETAEASNVPTTAALGSRRSETARVRRGATLTVMMWPFQPISKDIGIFGD